MNITGEATTPVQGKNQLKVPDGSSFQGLTSFLGQRELAKWSYFPRGCCLTHSPLIFATQI